MFASMLSQITGQLDRRFMLNAFFPALLFSLLSLIVVISGAGGIEAAVELWERQATVAQVVATAGAVGTVFVFANLLANGTLGITRLFEGYGLPGRIARSGQAYHHARAELTDTRTSRTKRYPYGSRDRFAATSLGNVLRAAELYPMDRYGVDSVRVWPRLYHLLPDDLRSSMADARQSMEFLLVLAFLATVFGISAPIYLLVQAASLIEFYLTLVGGAVVAVVSYRAAITPASIYGDHVRTAFDLHRLELLQGLKLPRPTSHAEERRLWPRVVNLLELGDPLNVRYVGVTI